MLRRDLEGAKTAVTKITAYLEHSQEENVMQATNYEGGLHSNDPI